MHIATQEVKATKVKPRKPYVRPIRSKHKEEQHATRLDKNRNFAAWREVTHWVAGHKRPTFDGLDTFRPFRSKIYHTPEGTNIYQRNWRQSFQARAKAGRAEIAFRGYQKIQRANLKAALTKYLDDLVQQAAVMSIDWWGKKSSVED